MASVTRFENKICIDA